MSYQKKMMSQQLNVQPSPGQPATPGNSLHSYNNLGDMPPLDNTQQTLIWQQSQYLCDSGINSATPSINGNHGLENNISDVAPQPPLMYNYEEFAVPPAYGQPQVNEISGMQCGPPSVQPAVYSDSMSSGMSSSKMMSESQVTMDDLSDPSRIISDAVASMIDYQDPQDLAQNAIPELARLLNDEDHVVVGQAAMMVHQLSKKETSRHAIMNYPQMIFSLINGINTTADTETMRFIAGTLHNLSHYRQGLLAIFKTEGIPALVKLLSSNVESVLFYAITTLHNLLLHQDGSKQVVRKAGGLQKMIALLQSTNVKFLAITTDCLQLLAYGNQESKLVILNNGGPTELVRILQGYSYEKLLWTTSRVLKVLSVCSQNKPAIIAAGGMSALAMHLGHPSQRLVQNCLWTLRNLSDTATQAENLEYLLQTLVQMLSVHDASIVSCVAGILSNLTCNNQINKMVVFHAGGIETLIKTLIQAGDREDISEPTICALRHLTSRHPEAEVAQNAVRSYNGIPLLIKLLQPPSKWPLMKAIMGLIRNLALSPDNQVSLREHGAIPKIAQILVIAHQDIQRSPGGASGGGMQPVYVDGVKMEEVLEGAIGTLNLMSRETRNRVDICRLEYMIPILVQLIFNPNENIQRVATGMLCELSTEPEGLVAIDKLGAAARLCELSKSHNETLAEQATKILFRMKEKPKEPQPFQQRMMSVDKFRVAPPSSNVAGNVPNSMVPLWAQSQKPMTPWSEQWGNYSQSNNHNLVSMSQQQQLGFLDIEMVSPDMDHVVQYNGKGVPGNHMNQMGWFGDDEDMFK